MNYEVEYYQLKEIKNMDNGIFKLSWVNIQSAIIYGLIAVILYIISKGSIFGLEWKVLVDVGVLALLSSFVKNIFTTEKGNFVGVVKVIPPTE